MSKHPLPIPELKISAKHGVTLNIPQLAKLLSSPEPSFKGHKEILFAAFRAALIVSASRKYLRRKLILESVAFIDGQIASKRNSANPIARGLIDHPGISNSILQPLGGLNQIASELDSEDGFERPIGKNRVWYLTVIASVIHFHAVRLKGKKGFKQVSYDHANHAAIDLSLFARGSILPNFVKPKKPVQKQQLLKDWNVSRHAIPFLYAARFVKVGDGCFLEALCDDDVSYVDVKRYMAEWFERTEYLNTHVFSRMRDSGSFVYKVSITQKETAIHPLLLQRAKELENALRRTH